MAKYEIWIPALHRRGVCLMGDDNATDLEVVNSMVSQLEGRGLTDYVIHIRRNHKRVVRFRVRIETRIEQV